MSTRSMIAFQDADDNYYAIYCHFDGYLSHIGRMLATYFNTFEKAVDLVNRGELRSISHKEDMDEGYNKYPSENIIIEDNIFFEHFEQDFQKRTIEYYDSTIDFLTAFSNSDREFLYLWDNTIEEWIYCESYYTDDGKHISEWKNVLSELSDD